MAKLRPEITIMFQGEPTTVSGGKASVLGLLLDERPVYQLNVFNLTTRLSDIIHGLRTLIPVNSRLVQIKKRSGETTMVLKYSLSDETISSMEILDRQGA